MAMSGQKAVTTAGTAVVLGTERVDGPLIVKAKDSNDGVVAIGNDGAGDVTLSNGFRLAANDEVTIPWVGSLADIWLDSATNGDGVSWLKLNA